MKQKKFLFVANAVRWFDRVNGNTYHSVNVTRMKDGRVIHCPLQYGYGEQYRTTALKAMLNAGWLPKKYQETPFGRSSEYLYERENNYPIMWLVTDGLKRDCIKNGKGA
jgi:hypothetical protein